MNEAVREILDVFNRDDIQSYPRDTLDQALQYEEELTPHLIAILEDVLKDPESFMKRERFFGNIFAMNLLAHFGNQDVHEIIAKIMMLPQDVVDYLFGDMLTEDCPRMLYQTCGGRYEKIKELVLSKGVDEYARGSAMKALVFGVLLDDLPRSEAVAFFGGLFSGSESEASSHFWDAAASCVYELFPEELMETIKDAYERGLIWPGYIGIETFEKAMSRDKEDFLEEEKHNLKFEIKEDFH
ncbi:DUF1186 family protein, partial [bacterium]|nr:DUF1186 family protein [bacterium]